jgi:hypothetical protein
MTAGAKPETTRFGAFLKSHGIKPALLARESQYSRQHLFRLRFGTMKPSEPCIAALVAALSRLLHEPVRAEQLFDRSDDSAG